MQSRHLLPKAAYWLCCVPIGRTWCEYFSGEVIISITFFQELRVTKERLLGISCWNRSCKVDRHINDWRGKVTLCHPVGAVNVCGRQESQPLSNQLCWHQGGPGCLLVTWHCQEAACWGCLSPYVLSHITGVEIVINTCPCLYKSMRFGDLAFTETASKRGLGT